MQLKMEAKLLPFLCALVSAGFVAGHYQIPTVIMDTPTNSVCPLDSHLDTIRSQLNKKVSGMLGGTCETLTVVGREWLF